MFEDFNEKLKGWRGIILAWLSTGLVAAEHFFNLLSGLVAANNPLVTRNGFWVAVVMAGVTTLKLVITDAQGKYIQK